MPPQRVSSSLAGAHPHVPRKYLEEAKRRREDPRRKTKVCLSNGSQVLTKDERTNMTHREMTA